MKTLLPILVTLLLSNAAMASIKETELKVNLTAEGHQKLRQKFLKDFEGEMSERTDYYFDLFKNGEYQLKKLNTPIKLRFMWDGLDLKWQEQKTNSVVTHSIFTIKETISSTNQVTYNSNFFSSIEKYHDLLKKHDPYALVIARDIQKNFKDEYKEEYFSTHFNYKKRVKIKLKLDPFQYTVQLGETLNQNLISYELEAEIKKSGDVVKGAEQLERWLKTIGLSKSDIETTPAIDPTLQSEKDLKQLHSF